MKIGNTVLPHGLMLGPMAGYTDRAMRRLCRAEGAEWTTTEMVSAKAVVWGDVKTLALARIGADEGPVALQLFGSEPAVIGEAVARMQAGVPGYARPAAVDINMGCPMKKIVRNGDGGALMKSPALIERIVRAAVDATDLPVTVKLRAGWDEESRNAVDCALAAEAGGAACVAVHGRTVSQIYSGRADRAVIAAVKAAVSIPVVGNGDVTSAEEGLRMRQETGCDGLMVARAAVGNPFIFAEIIAKWDQKPYNPPTRAEIIEAALLQLTWAVEDKGERVALPEARKQIAAYLRGEYGAAEMRRRINCAATFDEVAGILREAEAAREEETRNDTL